MRGRCEVCDRPFAKPGKNKTGVCYRCRLEGAEFARSWMAGLSYAGATATEIAAVIGTTPGTVRARLSERRAA